MPLLRRTPVSLSCGTIRMHRVSTSRIASSFGGHIVARARWFTGARASERALMTSSNFFMSSSRTVQSVRPAESWVRRIVAITVHKSWQQQAQHRFSNGMCVIQFYISFVSHTKYCVNAQSGTTRNEKQYDYHAKIHQSRLYTLLIT